MPRFTRPSLSRRQLLNRAAAAGAAASLSPVPAVVQAQGTPEAEAVPPIEHITDVVYGEVDGETLLLDIHRPPPRDAPRPAVVLLHGGGLTGGKRSEMAGDATALAEAGYVAFSVDYRLFRELVGINAWPVPLDDAQRAVRWIRANADTYGVDPERIGAYGHSSGGHLAALLGVSESQDETDPALAGISSRVTCVVDLSGETEFVSSYRHPELTEFMVALLGGTPDEAPEAFRSVSPLAQVDADSAPFLIIHGAQDDVVPVDQSRQLVEALHEAGVEVAYLELPQAEHMIPSLWMTSGPWVLTFFGVHLDPDT